MVVLAVERGQPAVSEQPAQTPSTPSPEEALPEVVDETTPDVTPAVEEPEVEQPEAPETEAPETEASEAEVPAAAAADADETAVDDTPEAAEVETEAPAQLDAQAEVEPAVETEPAAETEPTAEMEPVAETSEPAARAETPAAPAAPTPSAMPSPAMFAARKPAVAHAAPAAPHQAVPTSPAVPSAPAVPGATTEASPEPSTPSESVRHGRVGEDGTVYVVAADGSERAVGSYPGASDEEALAYFARKYDELAATADLLAQRVAHTDVSAHDARQSLAHLKEQIGEANVVGDLEALRSTVGSLEEAIRAKGAAEAEHRAAAKAEAAVEREKLVAEAEKLAATEPAKIQWKQSSARVRELLEEWKAHQRSGPRLDKDVEGELWKRFSHARTSFDKTRKAWFARLDEEHGQAKATKEALVKEAEALSGSTDWGPTAGAFKRLMQDWKRAGRASRADDDALWKRFKAAQDAFFNAKDEVVAAEEAEFSENLKVKEGLLVEAEAIRIDADNLDAAKAELRKIQDKWDAAGKVPRNDIRRVENRLRAVEQKVRDIEDRQWKQSDPELTARAASLAGQLERAVQGLEADLAAAQAAGDDTKVAAIESELATKKLWLESARGNLS